MVAKILWRPTNQAILQDNLKHKTKLFLIFITVVNTSITETHVVKQHSIPSEVAYSSHEIVPSIRGNLGFSPNHLIKNPTKIDSDKL